VLRSTFIHLPGVGPVTEAELWRAGILDWSDLQPGRSIPGISPSRRAELEHGIQASERAFREEDAGWFAHRLPDTELWRLDPTFRPRTAFLDIETTGLSPYNGIVTVVTVHGGGKTRTFIADDNLEELPSYMGRFAVVVTFNGRLFDIPFLEASFPQWVPPPAHIDLRFVLHRLGYAGGLKRIEQTLGLGDRSGVEGIHGLDAVRLWGEYRRGRAESLETLVRYNRADTVNLEPLLEFAGKELARRLLGRAR
jgi:uncharacterized protein